MQARITKEILKTNQNNNSMTYRSNISKKSIETLILVLFSIMPIVDSVNGFIIKGGTESILSIGIMYRLVVVITLIIASNKFYSYGTIIAIFLMLGYMLTAVLVHSATGSGTQKIVTELKDTFQWVFCPLISLIMVDLARKEIFSNSFVIKTIKTMSWIMVLTILVPYILNMGYSTYASGEGLVGYKAFYYATNGVTLLAIVSFSFSFSMMEIVAAKKIASLVLLVLSGICLILIGTKSAYLMLLLSIGLVLYVSEKGKIFRTLKKALPVVVLVLVIMLIAIRSYSEFFNPIIERTIYFFNQSDNLLSFVTSGRVDRIPLILESFASNNAAISILIGIGSYASIYNWVEMDFIDIFFEFGIIGLLFLLVFSIWTVKIGFTKGLNFYSLLIVFILVYAAIVGHVFTNSMSSMVFALCVTGAVTNGQCEEPRKAQNECRDN